jgi:hypothetical protein
MYILKRQSHEIFDTGIHFFHKSMAPRALINTLKYVRILFIFRTEISEFMLFCIARSRDSALCNIKKTKKFDSALCCIARSRIFGPFKVK